jgi:NADH:ubiquinone reductase (H+-translocating)
MGDMRDLDREKWRVHVAPMLDDEGKQLLPPRVFGYDTLVLAVGSVGNDFGAQGVSEHGVAIDSVDEPARFNRRMIKACVGAHAQYEPLRPGQLHVAIVGAGAIGVELVAELHKTMRDLASYGLDNIDFDKLIKLTVIEAGPRILGPLPERQAASTQDMLTRLGVRVLTGQDAATVTADGVRLTGGEFIAAEMVVWAAGIKAPDFLKDLGGLETDRINRLVVRDTLHTTLDDNISAIGDCASYFLPEEGKPAPSRAETSHQMASLVAKSIRARLNRKALPTFRYRDFGNLVNLSEYATIGNLLGKAKRGVYLEGMFARMMYWSLHNMHKYALHGSKRVAVDTAVHAVTRRTEQEIKLH